MRTLQFVILINSVYYNGSLGVNLKTKEDKIRLMPKESTYTNNFLIFVNFIYF
jgi:hypothetical protein